MRDFNKRLLLATRLVGVEKGGEAIFWPVWQALHSG